MKKIDFFRNQVFVLIFLSLFYLHAFAKTSEQSLDKIIAIVNDDVITKSELNQALAIAKAQIAQQQMNTPPEKMLRKQVLDQLINKKLQLQIAKQAGVQVTDSDLDNAISNVAKQNNISINELYERLNQEGMSTTQYRSEIRDQMLIQKVQQQEIISHINITPEEIAKFSRSKIAEDPGSKEYLIEDILLPTSDEPSAEEITFTRERAKSILTRLRKGQVLREIALSESNVKNPMQSEELEWHPLSELPTAFTEEVSHMQAKEIAGPIQTGNGFHILILKNVRATGTQQSALSKKQIEELLLQRKFEAALQTWVSKIRSQAYIVDNA